MSNKIKKILTVDDLVKFCQEQKFARFNSQDTGYQLAVKVPTTFEVEGSDDNHRDMTKLKIKILHTGINRNNSKVSKEAAEKAMKTIPDRPVLAAIHQLSNGDYDFAGHEIEIVHNDKTDKDEVRYIESQVGSFSSEPAFWEHDDELDKDFVCAYAYISNEYTKTAEIINRKGYTKNSCELFIDEMAYDSKEHCLDLIDFYVSGSTLLGTSMDGNEKEIGEGMQGSRADIADFSAENNSVKFSKDDKLIELLDKLNVTLSNFNNNTNGKEETRVEMNENFDEVTETEKVTETEETTEEEVTATENESEETVDETSEDETVDEENSEETTDKSDEETEDEGSTVKEDNACGGGGSGTTKKKKKNNSIECSYEVDGETKKFAVSLQEKIYAIQDLVNATYAEADNTYYGVSVYEDYVVMCDYWSGRYYKQSYTSENDNYSLTGDRVEVYAEFVTSDEQKELESMRSNYAALKEFKETAEKNELHAKREEILANENFASISEKDEEGNFINKDFEKLYTNMDNYSLEDLEKEAKLIYADSNMKTFAATTEKTQKNSTVKVFANVNKSKKDNRYGNLFSK